MTGLQDHTPRTIGQLIEHKCVNYVSMESFENLITQ
jgi:hypothetical protein